MNLSPMQKLNDQIDKDENSDGLWNANLCARIKEQSVITKSY